MFLVDVYAYQVISQLHQVTKHASNEWWMEICVLLLVRSRLSLPMSLEAFKTIIIIRFTVNTSHQPFSSHVDTFLLYLFSFLSETPIQTFFVTMEDTYDVVVLGTGIKECILSGLLSQSKLKVLNIDKNSYYGGESASLNLEDLFNKFNAGTPATTLGRPRDWNVDLCPKFLMGSGNLVKMLVQTEVTRYLDFVVVSGSFVVQDNKVHKVPVTATEALSSGLLGLFEKRRFKNFLEWVNGYEQERSETWGSAGDVRKVTAKQVLDNYSLSDSTAAFTGHAICLYNNDAYLNRPAADLVAKAKLYANSLARFGNSPFIYPKYGIGGIPEGFARLCAINGGLQMLSKSVEGFEFDSESKVCGVKVEGQVIKTKAVLADPSYLVGTPKVKLVERVARSICLLKHPVAGTNDTDSCQIIVPAQQTKRHHDIYIAVVSSAQAVCARGFHVACISTVLEGKEEKGADEELKPAFDLLGQIEKRFTWVSNRYIPTDDGSADNVFVTSSLDASSHFENETTEVLKMFPLVSGGKQVDLTQKAEVNLE